MGLNSEQTAKLKASVKAKLIEIGQYIDDQLTDYVMIMVTNKKSEKQMAEDLELFLGGLSQASSFSAWLHSSIRSLSSASSSNEKDTPKKVSRQSTKSTSKSVTNGNLNTSSSVNETDELAIQIESNEFNEDFGDESKLNKSGSSSKKKSSASSSSKDKKSKDISSSSQVTSSESPIMETTVAVSSQSKSIEKPLEQEQTETKANPRQNRYHQDSSTISLSSNSTIISKSISSCIGAVINTKSSSSSSRYRNSRDRDSPQKENKDDNNDEDEDDFDKTNRRHSTLSSVIKVSERRYTVPKSMQPNKSILLRAVDDANNSTKSQPTTFKHKSIADEKLEKIRSKRMAGLKENNGNETSTTNNSKKIELFSEHYRQSMSQSNALTKRLKTTENNRIEEVTSLHEMDTDKRMVQIESQGAEASREAREPKFIITMNGLDDEKFMKTVKKRSLSEMDDESNLLQNQDQEMEMEMEIDSSLTNASNETNKKKLIRCTFWPMCDKGEQCPYLHPNKPCTTFPACQFGQLCHYLHPSCKFDGYCTRSDCPYTHVIKKPGMTTPANKDASSLNISIKPDNVEAGAALNTNPDATLKSTKTNLAPKITINKIQPYYSLVNANPAANSTKLSNVNTNVSQIDEANSLSTQTRLVNNHHSSNLSYMRAAPSSLFYSKASSMHHAAFPIANQYTLVNRSNASPTIQINCKYAHMCKNPNCCYIHPNLPQKYQLKWTATNTTEPTMSNSTEVNNLKAQESTTSEASTGQSQMILST